MFGMFKQPPPPPPAPPKEDPADPLCLVFIPALVAILLNAEQKKGAPLTEAEVIAIRDTAACMAMPVSAAAAVESKRGYQDIVAEAAWAEWQRVRLELAQP
jgi:hypothetical protein